EVLDEITLAGDGGRLRQVFDNLFANARRYVSRPGRLEISADLNAGRLRLEFADSGPGVPAGVREKLFERLYRVEGSRGRAAGGSGLGLSICRRIVENHGGRISAAANSAGGLTIIIELPPAAV
ncbi:MAG: two-component system sensor histidine kinase BaeA, partial [Deltaproteobacteria bacterium]|nr:two-component system sensor histidine kinase BaeA [Deltaproteobacteria bacterium]